MRTRVCRLYGKRDIRIETDEIGDPMPGQVLVQMGAGGICGSDLHYYQDGGFGPIRVREPIILGHEVAGTIVAVGEAVMNLHVGDRVAVNPSQPCGHCRYCREEKFQHCLEMRFLGSALRFPHEQGGFRDYMLVAAPQCLPISDHVSMGKAACSEPLAVCVHAANRGGDISGRKVLVTGAGPIGALCAAVARHRGASEIVVTDLQDATLAIAEKMGATRTINVATNPNAMDEYFKDKGYFDLAFECSAAPSAIHTAISALRPLGRLVQVGVSGEVPVPLNWIVSKEIEIFGTHRFHKEFAQAVDLINSHSIDVGPMITATYALEDALAAFETAGDRARSVKVQLAF